MTKRASSKPASSPTPNTARCSAHDAARQLQMRKALRVRLRCGDGNTSEKVSQTMPNTAGTCVTLEIHFGRKPSRANSTSVVRPYSTQDSPCPCTSGSTITRPRWVTSRGSPSSSTSITDNALKAIGRPVASSRDQRDDGARQTFAFAGEDAVGEAAGRQRLAGDGAKLRHQFRRDRLATATGPDFRRSASAGRHGCAR